jgi:hypothetical protein
VYVHEDGRVTFANNRAFAGGGMVVEAGTILVMSGASLSLLNNNALTKGGGTMITAYGALILRGDTVLTVRGNMAQMGGGFEVNHNT